MRKERENITRFHILLCLSATVHNNVTFSFWFQLSWNINIYLFKKMYQKKFLLWLTVWIAWIRSGIFVKFHDAILCMAPEPGHHSDEEFLLMFLNYQIICMTVSKKLAFSLPKEFCCISTISLLCCGEDKKNIDLDFYFNCLWRSSGYIINCMYLMHRIW